MCVDQEFKLYAVQDGYNLFMREIGQIKRRMNFNQHVEVYCLEEFIHKNSTIGVGSVRAREALEQIGLDKVTKYIEDYYKETSGEVLNSKDYIKLYSILITMLALEVFAQMLGDRTYRVEREIIAITLDNAVNVLHDLDTVEAMDGFLELRFNS